jgi:hypothetical protein
MPYVGWLDRSIGHNNLMTFGCSFGSPGQLRWMFPVWFISIDKGNAGFKAAFLTRKSAGCGNDWSRVAARRSAPHHSGAVIGYRANGHRDAGQ